MQMPQCRSTSFLLPFVALVVFLLLSLASHVGEAQMPSQLSTDGSDSWTPWSSMARQVFVSSEGSAAGNSSADVKSEGGNWTLRKGVWGGLATPQEFTTHVEEHFHVVPSNGEMIALTLSGNSRHLLEFDGRAGNIINIIAQLMENRYDPTVSPANCYGLSISVDVRKRNMGFASPNSDNENSTWYVPESTAAPSAWSLFWNAMASILDNSALCELLPTVMLRVKPVSEPTSYYLVIVSRHVGAMGLRNYTCDMRVFIDERPAEEERWLQNIFALAIPLLFLLITAPCTLWRIDLVPGYLADIDIIWWLWYPSYALRNAVISAAVNGCSFLWGLYTERRARQRQRRLEERHTRLMEEMRGPQSLPQPLQKQQQEVRVGPTLATCREDRAGGDMGTHGEDRRCKTTAVRVQPSPRAMAREGELVTDFVAERRCAVEEKQQLLSTHGIDENEAYTGAGSSLECNHPAVSAFHARHHAEEGEEARSGTAPSGLREVAETAAPCVVHVRPPAAVRMDEMDEALAAHGHCDTSTSGHGKGASGQARVFLYKAGAGGDDDDDEEGRICRICRDGEEDEKLVSACECTGSVRWVHRTCLDRWRMESAKRNVRNVNRCEICREPFRISIRRRTLLWQSSQHAVKGFLLLVCATVVCCGVTVATHGTLGEMSCRVSWRSVSYRTMFNLDGLVLSMFMYFMLTFLAAFAFASVYSRWHVREDTVAHVHEFQALPVFWTRRRTLHVAAVYAIGALQALCLGYLVKLAIYRTSNIVWNWEASPSIGGVMFMGFVSLGASAVRVVREFIQNRLAGRAHDVVVETHRNEPPQQLASPLTDAHGQPHSAEEPQVDPHADVAPPRLRSIRAMEFSPQRPVGRQP